MHSATTAYGCFALAYFVDTYLKNDSTSFRLLYNSIFGIAAPYTITARSLSSYYYITNTPIHIKAKFPTSKPTSAPYPRSQVLTTPQLLYPAHSIIPILARPQIIITFDTRTRYRFLGTNLSTRNLLLQQLPLFPVPPHTLIALVLRTHRVDNTRWRIQPLSKSCQIGSANMYRSHVLLSITYSCGTFLPSTPRNRSSVSCLQGRVSRYALIISGDMGFASYIS